MANGWETLLGTLLAAQGSKPLAPESSPCIRSECPPPKGTEVGKARGKGKAKAAPKVPPKV